MKKSEFKKVLTKICFAYDILSKCFTMEDLRTMCQDDERLLYRISLYDNFDGKDHFSMVRDFVVEGILQDIISCAALN